MSLKLINLMFVAVLAQFATSASAEIELVFEPTNQEGAVTVNAGTAIFEQKNGITKFLENVVVTHSAITLTCDEAIIKTVEVGSSEIEYVRANNNLKMTNESGEATSEWGIYFVQEGIIKMYNNVRIQTDSFVLTGEEFVYDLETGNGTMLQESSVDISISE